MSTAAAAPEQPRRAVGWRDVLGSLRQPKVLLALALGFGSGLPFMLTGNTFGAWLRENDTTLTAIGFISWVGLAYSFKFLWAPIIDRMDAPLLGFLGRRRSWMALSQIIVGGALVAMAMIGPQGGLLLLGVAALVVAFASATQDIVVDAWRIESSQGEEELTLMTSAFQLGYRIALQCSMTLIFFLAAGIGWEGSYIVFGALMAIALAATVFAREPAAQESSALPAIWTPRGLIDSIVGPFIKFFQTHGAMALLMLAAISLYRLPDFVMGPMVNPFYIDVGISPDAETTRAVIGSVRLFFGLPGTLLGITAAAFCALRFGFGATLLVGAVIGPASNLGYALLAAQGYSAPLLSGVLFTENFSEGFAGAALVAYMSSLTSFGYVATQYALLTSFYSLLGKVLKGFSGQIVDTLQETRPLMEAFSLFFIGTALVGIPAVVLCYFLNRSTQRRAASGDAAPQAG
ncbi:MAG: MFS transporter [Alphaproteobacteria bacterium]|nr:MFS transporter [Alphaproteobacteria bacterium]